VKRILGLLSEMEAKLCSTTSEKLYIANSDSLLKLITKTNLESILDDECIQACREDEAASTQKFKGKASGDRSVSSNYIMNLFSSKANGPAGHMREAVQDQSQGTAPNKYHSQESRLE